MLTIGWERVREESTDDTKYIILERSVGKFFRQFCLPASADLNNMSASAKDGILTITVARLPNPEPSKVIDVQIASASDDGPPRKKRTQVPVIPSASSSSQC